MNRKFTGVLISLMILAGAFCPSVILAEEAHTQLSYNYENLRLFEGTKLTLNASATGGEVVSLMFSDDGSSFDLLSEKPADESVEFEIKLSESTNYFKTVLYDASGNAVAESDIVEIEGYAGEIYSEIWNVNFDSDITAVQKNADSTTIQFKNDAGQEILNADSSKLAGDIGAVDCGNSISVAQSPNEENGKSLKILTKAGSTKVSQLNSFGVNLTGSNKAAVFKMDYMFESFNEGDSTKTMTVMGVNDGKKWYPQLTLKNNRLTFEGKTLNVTSGKWYTVAQIIDFSNQQIICLIDDEILGVGSTEGLSGNTTRLRFSHEYTLSSKDLITWVDNFKAYEADFQKITREKVFEISADEVEGVIYAGNKIGAEADVQNYDDAYEVIYLTSPDGDEYLEASRAPVGERAKLPLDYKTTYIKAILTDSSGNEIAESNVLTREATELFMLEKVWDINFEDLTVSKNGAAVYICNRASERLENTYGDKFTANSGSAESIIEISQNPINSTYGKSLRLYAANDEDEVQINELRTSAMSDVVLTSWDCLLTASPSEYIPFRLWYQEGEDYYSTRFVGPYIKYGTSKSVYEGSGASFTLEKNKWYNIKVYTDTRTGKAACYINGEYLGTTESSKGIYSLHKLSNSIKGEGAECFVDNIKVTRMCIQPEIADIRMKDRFNLEVDFANRIPGDVFGENILSSIQITSGNNPVYLDSATLSDDGTALAVKAKNPLPTAVNAELSISFADGMELVENFTLDAGSFDVTSMNFITSGSKLGAKATVANVTSENKTVIMFLVAEKDGFIKSVRTLTETLSGGESKELSILPENADFDNAKVFFLDNWTSLTAIKDYIYTLK